MEIWIDPKTVLDMKNEDYLMTTPQPMENVKYRS